MFKIALNSNRNLFRHEISSLNFQFNSPFIDQNEIRPYKSNGCEEQKKTLVHQIHITCNNKTRVKRRNETNSEKAVKYT